MDDRITLENLNLTREMAEGFTAHCARRKAREVVGLAGIDRSEMDDVAQDLVVAVLERVEKFDPDIGHWNAFVTTIVEREVARILKARRAEKRGLARPVLSLATEVACEEEGLVELGATVLESEGDNLSATDPLDPIADVDWDHDLEVLLDGLPEDLRDVCLRLRTTAVTRVAKDVGLTRSALRHRLRAIRAHFERHGLGKTFE